ncbi:AP2-like ethylene-responsive transcription factor PLT1 [Abeliophyllum distichum]|uniref:AP2-like ethylene-responsive transcription factor PLT1 n=1 Tax=Abeliophyllum distichum TaxID=126358 RepID=A0ABD1TIV5_9LAMI
MGQQLQQLMLEENFKEYAVDVESLRREVELIFLEKLDKHGRWQARIGRVADNKDFTWELSVSNSCTQEEATEAYDIAAIKFRGLNAMSNFEVSRYDVKSILESSTLPIGGAAKRLKDAENTEMALDIQRKANNGNHNSHLTDGLNGYDNGWPNTLSFYIKL